MDPITWQAREFHYYKKSADWYWILGIISVVGAVLAIVLGGANLLFAALILFAGVALGIMGAKRPGMIEYEANERGVVAGDTLYIYQALDSFWIDPRSDDPRLILKSQKTYLPYIIIHIENIDPETVRAYLLQFLPEEPMQEPLSHKLAEYLGL